MGANGSSQHGGVYVEQFIPAVAMMALIVKVVDFLRYAKGGNLNGVVTQLIVWIAGPVVLLLVAQTSWGDSIPVAGHPLSKLGFWSVVFAGLSVASAGSLLKDGYKAVDRHQSAAIPTLVPPTE
jgi:hypothetical protein